MSLRLVPPDPHAPPADAEALEQERQLFAYLESLAGPDALCVMRELGATLSDEPSDQEMAEAWLFVKSRLRNVKRSEDSLLAITGAATMEAAVEMVLAWQAGHEEHARLTAEIAALEARTQSLAD